MHELTEILLYFKVYTVAFEFIEDSSVKVVMICGKDEFFSFHRSIDLHHKQFFVGGLFRGLWWKLCIQINLMNFIKPVMVFMPITLVMKI